MQDGPAVATLIFLVVLFAVYSAFSMLARRNLRAEGLALLGDHLLHWHYRRESWHAYCECQRQEIWFRYLGPTARYLLPGVVLIVALAWLAEQQAGLSTGLAFLATLVVASLAASTILGSSVRSFMRFTRWAAWSSPPIAARH